MIPRFVRRRAVVATLVCLSLASATLSANAVSARPSTTVNRAATTTRPVAPPPTTAARPATTRAPRTLVVAVPASMTDVFPTLAARFSAKRPGVVVTALAGPSVPQTRTVMSGSTVDVFVSPDEETMAVVGRARAVRGVRTFAETDMVLLVAPGNPLQIDGVAALGDERVRTAMCVAAEACGRAASRILEHSGIDAARVTPAADVRTTANRVVDGIADVAIVERTEALRLGAKVAVVEVGEDVNEIGAYQTAVASRSKNGALASAFVAFLAGREARAELQRAGFNAPSA